MWKNCKTLFSLIEESFARHNLRRTPKKQKTRKTNRTRRKERGSPHHPHSKNKLQQHTPVG
jgi:hypothetical protein